jgi:DNA gyrase subunit A
MIITKNGITIRLNVNTLRVMGRATQGVRLINISDNDEIAAVTKVDHEEEIEETKEIEGTIETKSTEDTEGTKGTGEINETDETPPTE